MSPVRFPSFDGTPIGFTDEGLAREVVAKAKKKEFKMSEFVHALVQSNPFRIK